MMFRQIVGYVPSTVVPAAVSFLMIYAYTRLLTPASYGDFSLVFSAMLVVQTSLFFAVPMAFTRFYPEALQQERREEYLAECYLLFYLLCLFILLVTCLVFYFVPGHSRPIWTITVLVLTTRSAVVLNQSVNRMDARIRRFSTIECAHALLGLGLGMMFVGMLGGTAEAVMLGLLVAATICMLADYRLLLLPFRCGRPSLAQGALGRLVRFSLPLIAVDTTVCLLALSDRFLLEWLGGVGVLGIYVVTYNLVERPTSLICTSVTLATFPASVQVLQKEGKAASGRQAGRNAVILLALMIPGCAGLALIAPYVSAMLIGSQFRFGVAALMPIMCTTALLRGIAAHINDHAFHLAGRPTWALVVYLPAALANICLNLWLIPEYGVFGAAWAGLLAQAMAVVAGCIVSRRIFPINWPVRELGKIVAAVLPMSLLLSLVPLPASWGGLSAAVILGVLAFSGSAILLNVCDTRKVISGLFYREIAARLPGRRPVSGTL